MQTDLISRDVVLSVGNVRKVTEYDEAGFGMTYHAVPVEVIKKIEAIEAVPVVRCRDCIHAVAITNLTIANRCGLGQKNCMRQRGDDGFGFAGVSVVYPDGFCDEGARMDGESEEDT